MSHATKLLLRTIAEAMGKQSEDTLQFLHRETGDVVTVSEHHIRIAEDWGEISGFHAYPPREVELIEKACDIMENREYYLPLPRRDRLDFKTLMAGFTENVEDGTARKNLRSAANSLFGNRLKKFRDAVDRFGLNERWAGYLEDIYYDAAREWCEKNGIAYIDRESEKCPDRVYASFRSPAAEYRGKPFWAWNGRLEREELLRQLNIFREMGFGGFFMHSRTSLATEYLGDEWFELINACADEAARLGMEAWLYDEDRWPSGSAGGMATEKPQNRSKLLRLRFMDKKKLSAEFTDLTPAGPDSLDYGFIAAFRAETNGLILNSYSLIHSVSEIADDARIMVFDMIESAPDSFYNGNTYLDTLSRPATDDFIALTYERYAEKCGDRLGKSIKGIFIDEPHNGIINTSPGGEAAALLPFTYRFAEKFESAFGYNLILRLPELFYRYKGEAVSPVKWQYMELLQRLFLENFVKPIADWCTDAGISLTGHFLHEDTLAAQAVPFGSIMRGYELMHCPGVDVLTEHNRQYCIAIQLKSAARQTGKKKMLSELYGATGWQMNFRSHKAVGDWQALYGVNIRCPHLSWYTMEGEAKRDYPASIHYQSAWYREYRLVEDYFARVGIVMEQGEPLCDVLYISPVESLWAEIGVGWNRHLSISYPELQKTEEVYSMVWNALLRANIDFDFGDEDMMERLGSADDGVLRIGKASYTRVLVCGMITMRRTTLELLRSFAEKGGIIVFAGDPPAYIDCVKSGEAAALACSCVRAAPEARDICASLAGNASEVITVSSPEVLFRARRDGDDLYVFMINENRIKALQNIEVRINHKGIFERWDAATGMRHTLGRDKTVMTLDFAPSQEYIFVIKQPGEDTPADTAPEYGDPVTLDAIAGYTLDEPNICVLDRACLKIGEEERQQREDILRIDDTLRARYGLPKRGGSMLQPWFAEKAAKISGLKPEKYDRFELFFEFDVSVIPEGEVDLIAERPERFMFEINGRDFVPEPDGFFIDNSLIRLPLPDGILKTGRNVIKLTTVFEENLNLEAIYLAGSFGVALDGDMPVLTALPEKPSFGRLDEQGLPFYGGRITYRLSAGQLKEKGGAGRYKLVLGEYEGACAVINPETDAAVVGWQPAEAVITLPGKQQDTIDIELALTRRNTFGPLHQKTLIAGAYSPENFRTAGDDYTPGYNTYPAGIFTPPVIYPEKRKNK